MSGSLKAPLQLRQRSVTVVVLCIFIVGVTLGGWAMARTLNHNVRSRYITHEAAILLNMMNSVRDYTSTQIRPALSQQSPDRFWPESVPSYSAQQVFERLREQEEYSRYSYKEAVLNPTSLRDKADEFEQTLIQQFRNGEVAADQPIDGRRMTPQGEQFYSAKAIPISKPSCLQCHSTPDVAPAYVVEQYGSENGFDWQLNEIVGAQMLYLPVEDFAHANRFLLSKVMAVLVTVMAVSMIVIRLWLRAV